MNAAMDHARWLDEPKARQFFNDMINTMMAHGYCYRQIDHWEMNAADAAHYAPYGVLLGFPVQIITDRPNGFFHLVPTAEASS